MPPNIGKICPHSAQFSIYHPQKLPKLAFSGKLAQKLHLSWLMTEFRVFTKFYGSSLRAHLKPKRGF
jgi:hypothetical protein